jgi:hypothetical protein
MSDKPMNQSRRDAVKKMMGGLAAVPLMNLVGMAAAQAEDLPHVTADDPTAVALKYVDKSENPEQHCGNCQFQTPVTEGEWVPCQLFPGKAVHSQGWCTSWTAKAGA